MRVLYDYQKFSTQRAGGITRYFAELFSHFSDNVTPLVSLKFNRNIYMSGKDSLFLRRVIDYDFRFRGKGLLIPVLDRINRAYSIHDLHKCCYDIFHPTYYGSYFIGKDAGRPVVVTIHDMIQELYPEDFSATVIMDKKKQIMAADRIVAVSENTRNDILRFYPEIDPGKIKVIYHGASFSGAEPERGVWPDRYILFVGRREGYKNFLNFMASVRPLLEKERDLYVVCAGEHLKAGEADAIRDMGLEGRVVTVRATDAQLVSLYREAQVFVFPSLYEGFGLPILEAFASGCPVCLSDASCFPEIAQDAALYFDPSDSASVCDTVSRCIHDTDMRRLLIRKGESRLAAFSWKESAYALEKVYSDLV